MKTAILLGFALSSPTLFAQQAFYDVTSGTGNGVRFWQSDQYKIHMGNTAEYHYGPVTDYSIKMNMSNTTGRGWTWGVAGLTPIAGLNIGGDMQIAGKFISAKIGIGKSSPAGALDIDAGSQYAIRTLTSSRYVIEVRNTSDAEGGWWLVNDPNGSFAISLFPDPTMSLKKNTNFPHLTNLKTTSTPTNICRKFHPPPKWRKTESSWERFNHPLRRNLRWRDRR